MIFAFYIPTFNRFKGTHLISGPFRWGETEGAGSTRLCPGHVVWDPGGPQGPTRAETTGCPTATINHGECKWTSPAWDWGCWHLTVVEHEGMRSVEVPGMDQLHGPEIQNPGNHTPRELVFISMFIRMEKLWQIQNSWGCWTCTIFDIPFSSFFLWEKPFPIPTGTTRWCATVMWRSEQLPRIPMRSTSRWRTPKTGL